jgi:hypothetical protein
VDFVSTRFASATDKITQHQLGIQGYLASVRELGGVARDATLAADLAAKGFQHQNIAVTDVTTGVVTYTQALTFAGKETEDLGSKSETVAEQMAKLTLESQKLELEWAKLEAHTREISFKATVDLQIANVEAQAQQFEAIMQSLNTSIESTGDTLLGLATLFSETSNKFGVGSEIASILRKEEERRAKAFEQQKALIDAQLTYLRVSTEKLASGDALITINAEGIEEELRTVLFKIIELAHIEASKEAGPLLLGLPQI